MDVVACVLLLFLSFALHRLRPLAVCGASVWGYVGDVPLLLIVICGTAGWGATEVHWMSHPGACDVQHRRIAQRAEHALLSVPPDSLAFLLKLIKAN